MNPHNIFIRNIRQANENDRLAIFVGAGISKSSDTDYIKLPLWSDLINELKSDLSATKELDYLKLAQLYYLEFGEQTYNQTLKKYFPENINPSNLHRTILKLNPRIIITTNWDCIIENAIEQEGYLYDTICMDKDLVSSTSPNKFIKIHGDFKNYNIVFKEDDYLNYSKNFPLIENYIKSIFSTHTALFLGYSYNDINLKHIMKWIQSHSSSSPPMYLLTFEKVKSQESYLKNHGITTLVLDTEKYSIDKIKDLDEKSALIQSFLTSITQNNTLINQSNEQEIINFIYERIKHLKQQNTITHNQIQRAITNCRFLYDDDGLSILELLEPKGVLTTDNSHTTRSIHEKFLNILNRLDSFDENEEINFHQKNPKLNEIFSILSLAYIKGIVAPHQNESGKIRYFINKKIDSIQNIKQQDRKYISFSLNEFASNDFIKLLASESYKNYKNKEYKSAFENNSKLIASCKKYKIYSTLLIALFNKNSILWRLKYSFSNENRNEFGNEAEVDLQDEFFNFPRLEIKKNQALYDFLSLHSIYQKANECTKNILELTETIANIKAGGISFNNNADKPTCTHINLLMFALKNYIIIDQHPPYKAVMKDFFKISILRQSFKKTVTFNQYEIYSAIQFYTAKELQSELRVFFKSEDSAKQLSLSLNNDYHDWMVCTILPNLINNLIQKISFIDGREDQFENCVRLLAFLHLDDTHISKVMGEFSRLINSNATTIGVYESINEFLLHQHNLFSRKIENETLLNILNTLIDKIIYKKTHGWDQHAILNGSINNLYSYIGVAKGEYADVDRVHRLLFEIKSYNPKDQRSFSKSILFNIFNISGKNIRNNIKRFIKDIISKSKKEGVDDLEFELWSVAVNFKNFETKIVAKLDKYLDEFRDGRIFSSQLYSFKGLTEYLIENKKIRELESINKELSNLIDNYKNRSKLSSI